MASDSDAMVLCSGLTTTTTTSSDSGRSVTMMNQGDREDAEAVSAPIWDGETELTPENVKSFRYTSDLFADHFNRIQPCADAGVRFELDHETGSLVEVETKGATDVFGMAVLKTFAPESGVLFGAQTMFLAHYPERRGSQTLVYKMMMTDGAWHPTRLPAHLDGRAPKMDVLADVFTPHLVVEAEWMGTARCSQARQWAVAADPSKISEALKYGEGCFEKVRRYLESRNAQGEHTTKLVFLIAPDTKRLYLWDAREGINKDTGEPESDPRKQASIVYEPVHHVPQPTKEWNLVQENGRIQYRVSSDKVVDIPSKLLLSKYLLRLKMTQDQQCPFCDRVIGDYSDHMRSHLAEPEKTLKIIQDNAVKVHWERLPYGVGQLVDWLGQVGDDEHSKKLKEELEEKYGEWNEESNENTTEDEARLQRLLAEMLKQDESIEHAAEYKEATSGKSLEDRVNAVQSLFASRADFLAKALKQSEVWQKRHAAVQKKLEQMAQAHAEELEKKDQVIRQKDQAIRQKDQAIRQKDQVIRQMAQAHAEEAEKKNRAHAEEVALLKRQLMQLQASKKRRVTEDRPQMVYHNNAANINNNHNNNNAANINNNHNNNIAANNNNNHNNNNAANNNNNHNNNNAANNNNNAANNNNNNPHKRKRQQQPQPLVPADPMDTTGDDDDQTE